MSVSLLVTLSTYAVNITTYDGSSSAPTGWYGTQENQETEPGTLTSQLWDMESFDLNGSQLKMTGGYNFTSPSGYGGFAPGDIFFDVNGGGYDFVATVSSAGPTYNVYTLPANTFSVYFAQNAISNPWKYKNGGSLTQSSLPVSYGTFSDFEGLHYTATLDISWLTNGLSNGDTVTIHNTMECGNDNLIGRFTHQVPDNGNSFAMMGLVGIMIVTAKRYLK